MSPYWGHTITVSRFIWNWQTFMRFDKRQLISHHLRHDKGLLISHYTTQALSRLHGITRTANYLNSTTPKNLRSGICIKMVEFLEVDHHIMAVVVWLLQMRLDPDFMKKYWKCDVLQIIVISGRVVIIVKRLLVKNPFCLLLLTWKAQMRFSRSLDFFTTQSRASSEHHWILQNLVYFQRICGRLSRIISLYPKGAVTW